MSVPTPKYTTDVPPIIQGSRIKKSSYESVQHTTGVPPVGEPSWVESSIFLWKSKIVCAADAWDRVEASPRANRHMSNVLPAGKVAGWLSVSRLVVGFGTFFFDSPNHPEE